jgi:hypothetical protein
LILRTGERVAHDRVRVRVRRALLLEPSERAEDAGDARVEAVRGDDPLREARLLTKPRAMASRTTLSTRTVSITISLVDGSFDITPSVRGGGHYRSHARRNVCRRLN